MTTNEEIDTLVRRAVALKATAFRVADDLFMLARDLARFRPRPDDSPEVAGRAVSDEREHVLIAYAERAHLVDEDVVYLSRLLAEARMEAFREAAEIVRAQAAYALGQADACEAWQVAAGRDRQIAEAASYGHLAAAIDARADAEEG